MSTPKDMVSWAKTIADRHANTHSSTPPPSQGEGEQRDDSFSSQQKHQDPSPVTFPDRARAPSLPPSSSPAPKKTAVAAAAIPATRKKPLGATSITAQRVLRVAAELREQERVLDAERKSLERRLELDDENSAESMGAPRQPVPSRGQTSAIPVKGEQQPQQRQTTPQQKQQTRETYPPPPPQQQQQQQQ
eukprot:PhM_4_TR18741/c6_g1_i1/m.1524